jgi:very-short-patch-repair endonuclease
VTLPQRHVPKVARPGKPVSREAAGLLFADLDAAPASTEQEKTIAQAKRQAKEEKFRGMLRTRELRQPDREWRFHPTRKWAFDYAWPEQRLALEVEGGAFMRGGGRHNRGTGFRADCEKYSEGAVCGWRILRVLPEQLTTYFTIDLIARALAYPLPPQGPLP